MAEHFERKDFHVVLASYFFSLLFPAVAAYTRLHPPRYSRPGSKAHSSLSVPPFPFHSLLYAICTVECDLTGRIHLPFGTSVYALAR
jgi:hypothetical protein